ncbi:precorrin-6A reductase [Limosilactobacillus sp. STM2_1]|uniref:Precorrin-6A reductase n=1 Tax=Limosilactobacillus rudii TaxID=2759755 RepID=A0A7W3YNB5_9LACO|nr:precorrin-6A reductase [Limosilactobacillus rudii]MBB1079424.1 precorrin-6A reductase [Limosilactobacillus rudii]MBB1097470.1 precorrin-6A reductase [Limosilactobacillus rudii]MCD7134579.1 precorrin-6A reductase [Limosilactobacillus rudii]
MILLLGGTTESLEVADRLTAQKKPFILSVISDYGAELAHQHSKNVIETTFSEESFACFCHDNQISFILDATHPFARVISQLAIKEAEKLQIPYLRYERQNIYDKNAVLKIVDSLNEACEYLKTLEGVVYLSTGSKTAPDYAENLGVKRLHIRVLPTTKVMDKLTTVGFIASQIDAIQGPFSTPLNYELFKRAHAKAVVTKESGRQGGIQEKITACEQLRIPCVIIRRPQINYPAVVGNLDELVSYLEENDEW